MSKISEENGDSILNSENLEIREYQIEIANKCLNKNSLVVLPTGLGKTIIAVLVVGKTLEIFPKNSKVIVLAPTRPLINQHYNTFSKFLSISQEKFAVLTGKTLPEKRIELYKRNLILFYTPQTLRNDLVNRRYFLEDTALIIYDEAHHASGDYAYTMIADEYQEQNPDGVSLGLTASPGASRDKITTLCKNLHIPVKNIHIRTRKDTDVKNYLKPMDIYKIGVNLTSLMKEAYNAITIVLEERLQYLSQLNFLNIKSEVLHTKTMRKDLLKLNQELVSIIQGSGEKTGVYSALSVNAQALILFHMIELIEQQGLDVLLYYLEKLQNDARKKNSSKAVKILAIEARIRRILIELKKNRDFSPEFLIHPKYKVLLKVILDELHNKPQSRILVFVKLRDSVKNIVKRLGLIDEINAVRFVGQATKSVDDRGLSQKRQIEILDQFKQGVYNVLVSTNVGEEGLDIAECDLVIFYDVVASEIRLIQRKGRTARHREGKVIILYCKETHDEIYLKIALNKLKRMNINLKNPQQLKDSYSKNTTGERSFYSD
ncbi:MAG: DEAD/DEAH box helicase family protein [Candidatus Hodarchaeales archaeon]|jgi:Fanconi anemia group M protein